MEKIKRPKKVSRNESAYQNQDDFQANTNNQLDKIYDKLDELVEKDELDEKALNNQPIIKCGSKVITATNSSGVLLFTVEEMKKLFNITKDFSTVKVSGCVVNGDTNAFSGNYIGMRISSSNHNLYVLLDQTVSGTVNMRANYTLFYNK